MTSNWVGMACGYIPYGQAQFRVPLALQAPWGVILFIGLATFIPDSPRQLIRTGRIEEAKLAFSKVRRELHSEEAQGEFLLMKAQIEYEKEREIHSISEVFKLYRHRTLWWVTHPTGNETLAEHTTARLQSTS